MAVDASSLIWARSNAQTTANLAAASIGLELKRNPSASTEFLVETARAVAAWNGYRHGSDSVAVHLERQDGKTSVLVERDAGVYFSRVIRPQPVAVRARAAIDNTLLKAGL